MKIAFPYVVVCMLAYPASGTLIRGVEDVKPHEDHERALGKSSWMDIDKRQAIFAAVEDFRDSLIEKTATDEVLSSFCQLFDAPVGYACAEVIFNQLYEQGVIYDQKFTPTQASTALTGIFGELGSAFGQPSDFIPEACAESGTIGVNGEYTELACELFLELIEFHKAGTNNLDIKAGLDAATLYPIHGNIFQIVPPALIFAGQLAGSQQAAEELYFFVNQVIQRALPNGYGNILMTYNSPDAADSFCINGSPIEFQRGLVFSPDASWALSEEASQVELMFGVAATYRRFAVRAAGETPQSVCGQVSGDDPNSCGDDTPSEGFGKKLNVLGSNAPLYYLAGYYMGHEEQKKGKGRRSSSFICDVAQDYYQRGEETGTICSILAGYYRAQDEDSDEINVDAAYEEAILLTPDFFGGRLADLCPLPKGCKL